jgi:hypothetical protein
MIVAMLAGGIAACALDRWLESAHLRRVQAPALALAL